MKAVTLGIAAGLSVAGFLTGAGMKRLTAPANVPIAAEAGTTATPARPRPGSSSSSSVPEKRSAPVIPAGQHSKDTLATLANPDSPDYYGRLALWLVDARAEDVAACWAQYPKGKPLTDAQELIFMTWMRLDPDAGMAAVKGTDLEYIAWWSWGSSDPDTAFNAGLAKDTNTLSKVLWGIGQFNPDWVRDHIDQIPEGLRAQALAATTRWQDARDPEKVLDFNLKYDGFQFDEKTFRVFFKQDPMAALEWAIKNPSGMSRNMYLSNQAINSVMSQLGDEDPQMLARLANAAPPGNIRRQIDSAIFQQLLQSDPKAAEAQALSLKSPRIASERLAAVGLSVAGNDPEHAFSMMEKILAIYPDAISPVISITTESGNGSSRQAAVPGMTDLVAKLVSSDPARMLEMQHDTSSPLGGYSGFETVASSWMQQDPDGLAAWISNEKDPAKANAAIRVGVNNLVQNQKFEEAIEWSMSSQDPENQRASLTNVLANWSSNGPDAARQWLENSDLPEADKNILFSRIPSLKRQP